MLEIHYLPDRQCITADPEAFTLLDVSLAAGIPHTHVCGGNARCSTCRVVITEGLEHCAPRNPAEQALAEKLGFPPEVRLSCQTEVVGSGLMRLRRLSLDAEDMDLFFDEAAGYVATPFTGKEKEIAILFADIRGFTSFSESLLPYDVIYILNRYFQRMGQVIHCHGGTINLYIGDGLMALFGIEQPQNAVERAIRAGVGMLEALEQLNPAIESLYGKRLRIGIGIHYGNAVIGAIGDPRNPQWTAIGDAVNFASRIESANKPLGTTFLISANAYQSAHDHVIVGRQFEVAVPGKSGEHRLYEVVGVQPPTPESEMLSALKQTETHHSGLMWLWQGLRRWWRQAKQWVRALLR